MEKCWDVVVIGGGHAGCEAALAAGRVGARTALITANLSLVGSMPCNCSIGGPAKGHLVSEIDALGGEMGRNIDRCYTHIRVLNTRKGPAVRALRAQADKDLYSRGMRNAIEASREIEVIQAHAIGLSDSARSEEGFAVATREGFELQGRRVVVATGTFLNGAIHIGDRSFSAGRAGEEASVQLAASLGMLGLEMGRLKTGTVPRVSVESCRFEGLRKIPSETQDLRFSVERVGRPIQPLLPCWRTETNQRTHATVRSALGRSALVAGRIQGAGPRYCPSIEAKLLRFPEREAHGVFLELEGWDSGEVYVQGTSNSLPVSVQEAMIRSIDGLEKARITRPGYAIEYDYVRPSALAPTLGSQAVAGLYLAGQVNGSSGYEEAAAQGVVAGANAALDALGLAPLIVERGDGYMGVLIDDLIHSHADEPYRLLTSRAESRLWLSQANAHARLTALAYGAGLVDEERVERVRAEVGAAGVLREGPYIGRAHRRARELAADRLAYAGYRARGPDGPERTSGDRLSLGGVDWTKVPVKDEVRARLQAARAATLEDAARVRGITAADLRTLAAFAKRRQRECST